MKEEVSLVFQKKAEQIAYASEILVSSTRDWQMIREYMSNRIKDMELTDTQKEKLARYTFIYNQLVSGKYTENEVLHQVMKKHDIKMVQAYEDMRCTREIWNTVLAFNKQFELKLELQIADDLRRKCVELGDMKSAAAFQKNKIAIQAMLPAVEEDNSQIFTGHSLEAVFNPQLLGAPAVNMKEVIEAINAKRKVKIKTELFESIHFDDGSPNEADTSK